MDIDRKPYFQPGYNGALGYELPDNEDQLFKIDLLPSLNIELFNELYSGDDSESLLTEMLQMFVDTLPKENELLKEAHDNHDWSRIESLAHKMKGGCYCIGVHKLAIACQFLERYILAGHTQQREKLYKQMIDVISDTVPEVNHWIKSHH